MRHWARPISEGVLLVMLELIGNTSLFKGLPTNIQEEIARVSRARNIPKHKAVFHEGDRVDFIYLITRGRVKHMQHSLGGNEVVLRLESVGAVMGSLNAAERVQRTTAWAIDPLSLMSWDITTFNVYASRFPQILHNANSIIYDRLHQLESRFVDISAERVSTRLAKVILCLMEKGIDIDGLSQAELAQMIGTTLFTVNRILGEWAVKGLVRNGREALRVADVAALTAIATTPENDKEVGGFCRLVSSCPNARVIQ